MLALIMTVITVVLVSFFLYAGTSVLQSASPIRSQTKENTISAFQGLAAAYQAYMSANGVSPNTSGSNPVACNNAQFMLVPTYLKEIKYPVTITGMSCYFGNDATYGDYFCYYTASSAITQVVYNGFSDAASSFPTNSNYISKTACDLRANTTPATWPAALYVTYFLQGQ